MGLHSGRKRPRAPPALELAGIGAQLPPPLGRGVEAGDHGEGEVLVVLLHAGDAHRRGLLSSFSRSAIRSTRPRQAESTWSSACRARLTASRLVRTSCSRPRRSLLTRPARSNTATCFCTAAKLIGYVSASPHTEGSSG